MKWYLEENYKRYMKNKIKIAFLIYLNIFLLGCESMKKGLGVEKSAPDEFLVQTRNSLTLPPDYKLIEPDSKKDNSIIKVEDDLKTILSKENKGKVDSVSQSNESKLNSSLSIESQILKIIK